MKWILAAIFVLVLGGGAGIALFPMSTAAGFLADKVPEFRFASASGSVWNGKLSQVAIGQQSLGDLSVKVKPAQLVSGQAAARLGMARPQMSGEADFAYNLAGGKTTLEGVRIAGKTAGILGLPATMRHADGQFTVAVSDISFVNGVCEAAKGEVWTDILTRLDLKTGWKGPELRGPVTCEDGKVTMHASGAGPTGETVSADIVMGQNLSLGLVARVANPFPTSGDTLTNLGFLPEDGGFVLRREIGGAAGAQ
jgi:hypothetical protein